LNRSKHELRHIAAVDAWLERSIDHDSSVEIVELFRAAVEAIWSAVVTTLGPVTLTAVAERVLARAAAQHAFLATINTHVNGDRRSMKQLCECLAGVPRSELIDGLRFGLIELITVIGRLSAEILSDELHATLSQVSSGGTVMAAPTIAHATSALRSEKVSP
jgi:hypothetical protein